MKHRSRLLRSSNLCFSAIALMVANSAVSAHAFDPNAGAESSASTPAAATASAAPAAVNPRLNGVMFPQIKSSASARPPIAFAPLAAEKPAAEKPVAEAKPVLVDVPTVPLPTLSEAIAANAPKPAVSFPPVDDAVKAKAEKELRASAPVVAAPTVVEPSVAKPAPLGFIAPLPLISAAPKPVLPATPAPVAKPAPAVVASPVVQPPAPTATAPSEQLSRGTKSILSTIPSHMDKAKPTKPSKVSLNRMSPSVGTLASSADKIDAYEAAGIKISVRRPGLDTNYELNRAFTALSGGDSATALQVYKDILSTEPTNADALFGAASIHHRQGQLDKARPLYGTLLKHYPNHRNGITNFLALVSDESPQESLAELERLEQRNPDFSPIPAQEAVVLSKLGYADKAREKMLRAIELSPDNLAYKYNLAIMLDAQGNYEQAASLYRLLIEASNRGAAIPATPDALQKRLNYISAALTSSRGQ